MTAALVVLALVLGLFALLGFVLIVMAFLAEEAGMLVAGFLTALIAAAALTVEAAFTFPDAPHCRLTPSTLVESTP